MVLFHRFFSGKKHKEAGQLLIELLVAMALAAILLPAIAAGFVASRQGRAQSQERLSAVLLSREAEEALRVVREAAWANVANDGVYHPVLSGFTWSLASGTEVTSGFTRYIQLGTVRRDASGAIVASGGTIDPSTKSVLVTVSWGTPIVSSVTSNYYITRYLDNIAWNQTTQADFDAGTKTQVVTTNTDGGEVTLGLGNIGRGNWCAPSLAIPAADLPKNGVANAVSAIEGKVFAGTGDNASGVSYATVNVSNTNPPTASVVGTSDGFKTNGIFGETNYAYLATDNNFKEIEIIDISSTPYAEAGYFNAPGNGNANSIYVVGNVGYMTSGNIFYTFDLSSKSGSRPLVGSTTLAGTGIKIFVLGNYAYVAIHDTPTQLQIVDVSNPASPSVVGQAQLNAGEAIDVFVNATGTRAYLATAVSSTQKELFILDVTTKTGDHNTPVGSYESSGMDPRGITVMPGARALLVGVGAEEYQALNITDETNPVRCGGLNIDTGVHGVATVLEADFDAYSYIITGDATTELKIIEGGPGGLYALSGEFESSTLDALVSSTFNRFIPDATTPPGTTLEYQMSGASALNNSCTGVPFTYVGPDGTSATKFSAASAIPISAGPGYTNPARCFRYKVYFATTNASVAPVLNAMTINYSP